MRLHAPLLRGALLLFLVLLPVIAWEYDDDLYFDTIEITAGYEDRVKREVPDVPEDESPTKNEEARAPISITCRTARAEEGVCKPFNECYPLFFLRSKDEPKSSTRRKRNVDADIPSGLLQANENVLERGNFELESIYRNISGPCDKDILDAISQINIGKGVPTKRDEYVCCPNEQKPKPGQQKPSRPPAPTTPRPEVTGTNKCGKIYVDYRADEMEMNGNITEDEAALRIVNGRPANKGEFPWAVALMKGGRQFCGGSLVSNSHILTAAHCVYYMNQLDVSRMQIYIGDYNIYSTSDGPHEIRTASNIYYHRGFSMKTLFDDVAVIRLSKPVQFTKYIQPVCLHTGEPRYDTGTLGADVVGWGQVSAKGSSTNVLHTVNVRVLTPQECVKAYGNSAPAGITPGMVCAGGKGRDSCKGDSGGPLTINSHSGARQIGLVSWGIGCATYPGVYSRIDRYLPWIYKNQR